MQIHADIDRRLLLHGAAMPWVDSPVPGLQRPMPDRIDGEVARAPSIVRYAPGSHFTPHTHGCGEEFLVLEGVFLDEHGGFPAGAYRSAHRPKVTATASWLANSTVKIALPRKCPRAPTTKAR